MPGQLLQATISEATLLQTPEQFGNILLKVNQDGSRVLLNPAESGTPGSAGEFGWGGAANTHYWVDPKMELVGIFMTQHMLSLEPTTRDFQVLTYQAIVS